MSHYLTVGDGNFSFSLSLANQLRERGGEWTLLATSLETEEELQSCHEAINHAQRLQQEFEEVEVILGVNATKLSIHPAFKGRNFDTIIFNFPHVGGKSDIKRNRQLLRDFFSSASSHLSPLGEVRVALCVGQGGTAVDCISRGYENTWQVVEQAAEGGLMLSAVKPFQCKDFPGYTPTGYRGMDKAFNMVNSLTHTFTLPQPAPRIPAYSTSSSSNNTSPPSSSSSSSSSSSTTSSCPHCCDQVPQVGAHLTTELFSECFTHPFLHQPWHPVSLMRNTLCQHLLSHLPQEVSYKEQHSTTCSLHTRDSICLELCNAEKMSELVVGNSSHEGELLVYTPALEAQIPSALPNLFTGGSSLHSGAVLATSSPVIANPPFSLSPDHQPIRHELLIMVATSSSIPLSSIICSSLRGFIGERGESPLVRWSDVPSTSPFIHSKQEIVLSTTTIMKGGGGGGGGGGQGGGRGGQGGGRGEIVQIARRGVLLGQSLDGRSSLSCSLSEGELPDSEYCVVCLDAVAVLRYGLPDPRLLWTKDGRFEAQFRHLPASGELTFDPFLIHPPYYTHDISFWVDSTSAQFDVEGRLREVIRRVAGNFVISLSCLDLYQPVKEGTRVGYCYRLMYSPSDVPLGRSQAHGLQERLRERLSKQQGWELR